MAILTQVTEARLKEETSKYIKNINGIVAHFKSYLDFDLRLDYMNASFPRIQLYANTSIATIHDQILWLGYLLCLVDKSKSCQPLYWLLYNSKRFVKSVLGKKIMAVADSLELAFTIKREPERTQRTHIPLSMVTDSKSLFGILTKATCTTEKRFLIDLLMVRDTYKPFEIKKIPLLKSEHNVADALTKAKAHSVLINTILQRKIKQPIE